MYSITALASLLSLASASAIYKRCSPAFDEDYYGGYLPPQPCWFEFDTACEVVVPEGTNILVDACKHKATITGIDDSCVATIAEEHAREKDGRKTYGWTEKYGDLDTSQEGILVITNMSDETVADFLEYAQQ